MGLRDREPDHAKLALKVSDTPVAQNGPESALRKHLLRATFRYSDPPFSFQIGVLNNPSSAARRLVSPSETMPPARSRKISSIRKAKGEIASPFSQTKAGKMSDFVREMDPETLFVHLFCNKLAESIKNFRQMASYYVFDRRPGTLVGNFYSDAKKYAEYVKMFGTSRR